MNPLVFDLGGCVLSCRILDLIQSGLCSSGWGWGGGEATQTWVCRASCFLPTRLSPSSQNWPAVGPGVAGGAVFDELPRIHGLLEPACRRSQCVSVSILAHATLLSSHCPPIPNRLSERRLREGRAD